jgi:hypothetical protein
VAALRIGLRASRKTLLLRELQVSAKTTAECPAKRAVCYRTACPPDIRNSLRVSPGVTRKILLLGGQQFPVKTAARYRIACHLAIRNTLRIVPATTLKSRHRWAARNSQCRRRRCTAPQAAQRPRCACHDNDGPRTPPAAAAASPSTRPVCAPAVGPGGLHAPNVSGEVQEVWHHSGDDSHYDTPDQRNVLRNMLPGMPFWGMNSDRCATKPPNRVPDSFRYGWINWRRAAQLDFAGATLVWHVSDQIEQLDQLITAEGDGTESSRKLHRTYAPDRSSPVFRHSCRGAAPIDARSSPSTPASDPPAATAARASNQAGVQESGSGTQEESLLSSGMVSRAWLQ